MARDDLSGDAYTQLKRLQKQVDGLVRERVSPALSDAADRASGAAREARETAEEQAEALSERIRGQPLVAILVAAGLGYVLGRISR